MGASRRSSRTASQRKNKIRAVGSRCTSCPTLLDGFDGPEPHDNSPYAEENAATTDDHPPNTDTSRPVYLRPIALRHVLRPISRTIGAPSHGTRWPTKPSCPLKVFPSVAATRSIRRIPVSKIAARPSGQQQTQKATALKIFGKHAKQRMSYGIPSNAPVVKIDNTRRILVLGDGNFSFSVALCKKIGTPQAMVATSYDSYDTLKAKYGDEWHRIYDHFTELLAAGAEYQHEVDAMNLTAEGFEHAPFDRVIFNFPHGGVDANESENRVAKEKHRGLLSGLFETVGNVMSTHGSVHITLTGSHQFESWGVRQAASKGGFQLIDAVPFAKEDFPGYTCAWGDGRDFTRKQQKVKAGFGASTPVTFVFARRVTS